jgi:VWFA-related protein
MVRHLSLRAPISAMLSFILAIGSTATQAQQASVDPPPITIRTNSRLVMVDVVVTDKKGGPVTGLKAEDFTAEENGKKQKISVFVPPGATNKPAGTPLPPGVLSNHPENVSPAGVPTVLLLDANSQFKDQSYARSQMLKYVLEQGGSGRPIAVITLTDRLRVLQQFTSDPQVLLTAIKNLRPEQPILQPGAAPPASAVSSGDTGGGPGANLSLLIANAQAEIAGFQNLQVGYVLERRTVITIEAMRSLARMLGGLPGRKNVVWLTADFPFDLHPEDRNVSDEELLGDLPSVRQKSVSTIAAGSLAAQGRELHGQEIRDAEWQLASAGVAIYPVDIRGIMVTGIDVANTGTMQEIAAETGGKAYTNQNDIKLGIALAASDEKASYSIGYYPENKKWDGKYRTIKVKVAQGDTQVRHRKGYYAVDPTLEKGHNPEQDVSAALDVNAPATQISFMAQSKPTDPGKMRVIFLIDAHTLTAEETGGNRKMNVTMYASVYDRNGKNLATRTTKVDRAFDAATYQQILDKGMLVPVDIDIPAGGKELRLAVLDNKTGLIGTVNGPLGQ